MIKKKLDYVVGGVKRRGEDDDGHQHRPGKKRVRKLCRCGYDGCTWSGTEQSIYRHTKQKHGDGKPKKVYQERQFGPGGQWSGWIKRTDTRPVHPETETEAASSTETVMVCEPTVSAMEEDVLLRPNSSLMVDCVEDQPTQASSNLASNAEQAKSSGVTREQQRGQDTELSATLASITASLGRLERAVQHLGQKKHQRPDKICERSKTLQLL